MCYNITYMIDKKYICVVFNCGHLSFALWLVINAIHNQLEFTRETLLLNVVMWWSHICAAINQ